mgnify:CR=1 FL=1
MSCNLPVDDHSPRRYDAAMSKLLIIKTGSAPEPIAKAHGDFNEWFLVGLGLDSSQTMVVDVQSGQHLPAGMNDLAGVLVTGSPAMVSHREEWSERAAAWIASAHRAALPMLGVCYGHQLIAHALGGQVGPNPAGRRMGTKSVKIQTDSADLLAGLDPVTDLHVTHVEAVLQPPPSSRVLATTQGDPHHALYFGQCTWGVQFHPEFTVDIMASYIHLRADELRDESQSPEALLNELKDAPDGPRLLRDFAARLESCPAPLACSDSDKASA